METENMKKGCSCLLVGSMILVFAIETTAQNKCVIKPSPVQVRLNATDPSAKQDLEWYAQGVANMKKLPDTDPRSWSYQANIHGTTDTPVLPLWNTCQHGSYFFLSWHRIYIYFFEKIVRANSNPAFNLPYWDYDNPTSATDPNLQLPPQFRDKSSPLYVADRSPEMNEGGYLPVADVQTDPAMSRVTFTCGKSNASSSFGGGEIPSPEHFSDEGGMLESLPHNAVHDDVGGLMADPDTAAQDPIFWLHHANIDRLWIAWRILGHENPPKNIYTAWWSQKFYFYDETGTQCYLTAADIIPYAEKLHYKYQDQTVPRPTKGVNCPSSPLATPEVLGELAVANLTLSDKPVSHDIILQTAISNEKEKVHKIYLVLHDINFAKNPGIGYQIFLNLPAGQEPALNSPYYVGTLHFFGLKHSHQSGHEAKREFDISGVVEQLQKIGSWNSKVTITYVPVGPRSTDNRESMVHLAATPTIGSVSIIQVQ